MSMAIVYLAVIFALAFLAESMTEYVIGTLFDKIEKWKPLKWVQAYFALVVGVCLAVFYKLDLIALLADVIAETTGVQSPIQVSVVGFILTGLGIGRGAAYLHDFVGRYFKKPVIEV